MRIPDYTFLMQFYTDSEQCKYLLLSFHNAKREPLIFGPLMMGQFQIVHVEEDMKAGITTFHFQSLR